MNSAVGLLQLSAEQPGPPDLPDQQPPPEQLRHSFTCCHIHACAAWLEVFEPGLVSATSMVGYKDMECNIAT